MNFKLYFALAVLYLCQLCLVFGQRVIKSSLTFVIDDTASMSDDIEEVKDGVNAIFDAVLNSSESQIENFILVTFNDPDVMLRTITRNREEFKTALKSIYVNGGGDCPEFSMSGIERALQESLPASYLYVFTDASSKDYAKFERVKSLAGSKECQVVFVLTGKCTDNESDPDFKIYRQLADATSGQVFNLMKDEVAEILDYVVDTIKGRRTEIASGKFPPGYNNSLPFTLDSKSKDPIISVTGTEPKLNVTGPGGLVPKIENIVDQHKTGIAKITNPIPGEYIAKVGSKTDTTVVITATTSITFQHGFSTFKPSSINDTATRPIPGEKSFLSIKLNGDIELKTVKILDMDKNPISVIPLEVVDSKNKLYVTKQITPPDTMFRIAITGYDPETNTTITRFSMTPIEPQNPTVVEKKDKVPTVTIEGAPKINAEYDEPLTLKCKVSAYPKPDIIWEDEGTGTALPASVSLVELPYEYMSSLELKKVNKNGTYQCKASNTLGENIQRIDVETIRKPYFNVLESPKDTVIEYNTEGKLFCKVDSYPTAEITWHKNKGSLLTEDGGYRISPDGLTMTIKHMMPNMTGIFSCEAKNEHNRQNFLFTIAISGVDQPIIDKTVNEVRVRDGFDVSINCSLLQGRPSPTIRWFFKSLRSDKFNEYKTFMNRQNITLVNTNRKNSGTFLCVAKNIMGKDKHETDLIIEYPPKIERDYKKSMQAKYGDEITLDCVVDAVPSPIITWLKDDTAISIRSHINSSHSLSLRVNLEDSGKYTCNASNIHGTARKNVQLDVYVPVSIEVPKSTTRAIKIHDSTILPCHATGYPKPNIKWIFYNSDSIIPPKPIESTGKSLRLLRLQLKDQGFYTCVASNIGGSENMTYEVIVYAPPIIENRYPEKTFKAVEGDKVLRIECNTYGSPQPTITWSKDGFNIASGSPWYDVDNGTLLIKAIDKAAEGSYRCEARNSYGVDYEMYEVQVESYPKVVYPITTLVLEEGKKTKIECGIPHVKTDLLRWFKDGVLITNGELVVNRITQSNSGIYTCRVGDFYRSRSKSTAIKVGYKPRFVAEEEEEVDFMEGTSAYLSCDAEGEPTPQVSWWHNGKKLNVSVMSYEFGMKTSDQGQSYLCNVSNNFGYIIREFHITSRECLLDIGKDFNGNQPLIVTSSLHFPQFQNLDGIMFLPREEYVILFCPKSFTKFPTSYIFALCDGGKNIIVNGNTYNFSDLKCTEELEPIIRRTGVKCLHDNTEMVKVLYEMPKDTIEVYEVCLDKDNNVPLYAKHDLYRSLADIVPNKMEWLKTDLLPIDLDDLYDCSRQKHRVSIMLGKWFHKNDGCCFTKRQLVNPRDVFPGASQKATYSYLNVIPQWGTCNTENWDDMEQRVRNLAKSTYSNLKIWTGSAGQLTLPNTLTKNIDIYIEDVDHRQPVSQYLWKVVQDPATRASLAIVQINIPDLSTSDAYKYVKCRDICHTIEWMKNPKWHDVKKGFTYCCAIDDFKRAFDYDALFEREMENVLYDASIISESSLT